MTPIRAHRSLALTLSAALALSGCGTGSRGAPAASGALTVFSTTLLAPTTDAISLYKLGLDSDSSQDCAAPANNPRAELAQHLDRVKVSAIERANDLNRFDSAVDRGQDPRIAAAIGMLNGTASARGVKLLADPGLSVSFGQVDDGIAGTTYASERRIVLDSQLANSPLSTIASVLSHEALHTSSDNNSRWEEATATLIGAFTYVELAMVHSGSFVTACGSAGANSHVLSMMNEIEDLSLTRQPTRRLALLSTFAERFGSFPASASEAPALLGEWLSEAGGEAVRPPTLFDQQSMEAVRFAIASRLEFLGKEIERAFRVTILPIQIATLIQSTNEDSIDYRLKILHPRGALLDVFVDPDKGTYKVIQNGDTLLPIDGTTKLQVGSGDVSEIEIRTSSKLKGKIWIGITGDSRAITLTP